MNETSEDWLAESRRRVAASPLVPETRAIGRVAHVADGIAQITGLPEVRLGEVLRFEGQVRGYVSSLREHDLAAILLDEGSTVTAGSTVRGTGETLRVPVGRALLGRVIDPLGRPLDRDEPVEAGASLPIERPAPAIIDRALVTRPVETGILVVDALFALGRGQRELIIGDRATGKTSIAIDTIINQRSSDLICIYVAVGQRTTAVERVIEAVRTHGAAERCIFVVASSSSPAGLQWIAPFAGFAMAEYFSDRGGHVLVVIDDLTRHAATHRELALLTHEPPGREAYPGDIFYVHARLLERAAQLSPELGGGSLTALPIAETDAGNLAGYIPTNLISITDGQIVLSSHLFAANQRPAVDVGLSVSRVGGKAQPPALREVSGRVRLDYSQFLELEMFTRFGAMVDDRLTSQIVRGERVRALLRQPRFAPMRMADQVALLLAQASGVFDPQPVEFLKTLRERLPPYLDAHCAGVLANLARTGVLEPGDRALLLNAVTRLASELHAAGEGSS
jgi:F-type H+-transporting ATPase subunit alpha